MAFLSDFFAAMPFIKYKLKANLNQQGSVDVVQWVPGNSGVSIPRKYDAKPIINLKSWKGNFI